jgi:Aldehyde dehydrogenase family
MILFFALLFCLELEFSKVVVNLSLTRRDHRGLKCRDLPEACWRATVTLLFTSGLQEASATRTDRCLYNSTDPDSPAIMNGNGPGNGDGPEDVAGSVAVVADNYIGGRFVPPVGGGYMEVINPADSHTIGHVGVSTAQDVEAAVAAARGALAAWSALTIKQRATAMMRFHALVQEHAQELAELIVRENGKNITEALADVAKGNETVEWACSLPELAPGRTLRVSGQVSCMDRRDPLGV